MPASILADANSEHPLPLIGSRSLTISTRYQSRVYELATMCILVGQHGELYQGGGVLQGVHHQSVQRSPPARPAALPAC